MRKYIRISKLPFSPTDIPKNNFWGYELSGKKVGLYFRIFTVIRVTEIYMTEFMNNTPVLSLLIRNIIIIENNFFITLRKDKCSVNFICIEQ